MNADYRGRFSMLGQLAGAMNKLLPAARPPLLSIVPLQALNDIGHVRSSSRLIRSKSCAVRRFIRFVIAFRAVEVLAFDSNGSDPMPFVFVENWKNLCSNELSRMFTE